MSNKFIIYPPRKSKDGIRFFYKKVHNEINFIFHGHNTLYRNSGKYIKNSMYRITYYGFKIDIYQNGKKYL